jgi:hypothetical protein
MLITRPRSPTVCKMIMKLKKQKPEPKGVVQPVKKNVLSMYVVTLWDMTPCSLGMDTNFSQKSTVRSSRSPRENYVTLQKILISNLRNLCF